VYKRQPRTPTSEAADAYCRALTQHELDRRFLERRLAELSA